MNRIFKIALGFSVATLITLPLVLTQKAHAQEPPPPAGGFGGGQQRPGFPPMPNQPGQTGMQMDMGQMMPMQGFGMGMPKIDQVVQDSDSLYVTRGSTIFKIGKKDMKIHGQVTLPPMGGFGGGGFGGGNRPAMPGQPQPGGRLVPPPVGGGDTPSPK